MISAFFTGDSATALGKSRRRREILRCEREKENYLLEKVGWRKEVGRCGDGGERERERETWRDRKQLVSV